MRATIAADLRASRVDDLQADRVRLRAELDGGLARVDSSVIRLGGAEAVLDGSFGLIAGREGVLSYRVAVDSLHAFAPWLPGADTAVGTLPSPTPPPGAALAAAEDEVAVPEPIDPAERAPELATAGDEVERRYIAPDGARVTVNTTEVQAGIERLDREPRQEGAGLARSGPRADATPAAPDSAAAARAADPAPRAPRAPPDSLAGSLRASGTLRGNVTRFDFDGRAVVDELLYRGTYIGGGEAEYALADVGTPSPDIRLDAKLRDVRTAALAFDSVSARGRYHGVRGEGEGEAVIVARGTDDTEYRADAEFALSLDRSELRLADLTLRYDTVTWRTTGPGVISWAADAIELASIEVVNDDGGRVRLDGRLPVDGTGDLDVLIEDLDFAPVAALLQLEQDVEGRLNLDAHVAGTLERPHVEGTARLVHARLDGGQVPDVHATFAYAGTELTADATLLHEGRQLAEMEARLPIELSLLRGVAPRLLSGALSVDIRADSLPIEAIPSLSEQVADARGRVRGDVSIRGTFEDPVVTGEVDLDLGSVRVVPLDVRLEDVAGTLKVNGNVIRVDSLVGRSGGALRLSGEIGIESLTDPTFDLAVESRETLVIDTEDVTLKVDADISVGGSLAAIEVGGEVRTRSGVIRIPELTELGETEVVSLHSPATSGRIEEEFLADQLRLNRRMPLLDRLRLDVAVRVGRDVWLRSTEANVEIYTPREVGPLRIRLNRPGTGLAIEGSLATDRGEYEFMSRRFELTRGAATFVAESEINPVLQVAAEHEVRLPGREAFDIRVLLGGTVRDMEITLESTAQPPIAQT
ncbi:MAG: translocation/assembly module TamB domain-containing protein, partial [Gemmatimonadetes bacterium]|nr:translocation/assembly module TamB domain-containing protein [Gemmatimonadota bacterium]